MMHVAVIVQQRGLVEKVSAVSPDLQGLLIGALSPLILPEGRLRHCRLHEEVRYGWVGAPFVDLE